MAFIDSMIESLPAGDSSVAPAAGAVAGRENAAVDARGGGAGFGALRLLLFVTGGRVCATDISVVREIIPFRNATRLPGAPDSVSGLINLRGTIVTVLDLGRRVGGSAASPVSREDGSIVLVEHGSKVVGLEVEEVRDVHLLSESDLEPAGGRGGGELGARGAAATGGIAADGAGDGEGGGIIHALAHVGDDVVVLLDVQAIVKEVLL